MLKRIAIYGSEQAWVRRVVMSTPVTRQVALRFVAGGDLAAGLATARALNARGIGASLNYLGMHERDEGQAKAAADEAVKAVRQIGTQGLDAHISVKLTRVGLDIDEDFCRDQLNRIAESAADAGVFVRIDMEESPYVSRILRLFNEQLDRHGPDAVGIVLQ
ncbi:MAG: proline dehydrogenase family protein, partial [Candidatus Limnocylindrales bacterium]